MEPRETRRAFWRGDRTYWEQLGCAFGRTCSEERRQVRTGRRRRDALQVREEELNGGGSCPRV